MTVSEILFGFIYVTEGQRFTSAGLANYGAGSDWDQPWQLFRENAEYQLGLHDVGSYATKSWANKEKAALLRGGYNRVMITYIDQTGFCFEPLGEERFDPELGRSEGSLGMDEKENELCHELHHALHSQEAVDTIPFEAIERINDWHLRPHLQWRIKLANVSLEQEQFYTFVRNQTGLYAAIQRRDVVFRHECGTQKLPFSPSRFQDELEDVYQHLCLDPRRYRNPLSESEALEIVTSTMETYYGIKYPLARSSS